MSARRDPARELALLLRAPEPGACNVGSFVASHAKTLSPLLGIAEPKLAAVHSVPDERLVPDLQARLRELREAERAHAVERGTSLAVQAAARLAHTARWLDDRVVVDTRVLLGDLLAARDTKYLRFELDGGADVVIARSSLANCRMLERTFLDVAGWIDGDGVHLRWRAGRGGINWKPLRLERWEEPLVLSVPLKRPAATPTRRSTPSLIGDVLRDLGWPA